MPQTDPVLTLDPEELVQGRPVRLWCDEVFRQIAAASDQDLIGWFRQGCADNRKSIKTSDWHPAGAKTIHESMVHRLRTDTQFVRDAVWFALCTQRYWSETTLFYWVCFLSGTVSLVEYVAGDDFPRWRPPVTP